MKLQEAILDVVRSADHPVTPQEIRDIIKVKYPQFYGTEKAKEHVAKGNYNNLEHALLAPIYVYVRQSGKFLIDESVKPYRITLAAESAGSETTSEENFPDDLLKDTGTVYVLATGVFTVEGKQIIKIGFTTQDLKTRISQLYTTGSPFKFEELKSYNVKNYVELEQSLHKLLSPYRLSNAREYFSEDVLEFIEEIVGLHNRIQTNFSIRAVA